MKKSVVDACKAAEQYSAEHPEFVVFVMDKSRKRAVICVEDWIYRERILEGWRVVTKYQNGKEVS